MLSLTEIKIGKKIILESDPYVVLFCQHSKVGRAGAVLRAKLKNLRTGVIISKTFQGADKVEEAEIETKRAQYLYSDDKFYFMDIATYEQFDLSVEAVGESAKFFKEEAELDIIYFNGKPINLELPIKMNFKVIESPPTVKGNTADGGSKQVTIETGVKIRVPLFVKKDAMICINTQTGRYAGKAK